MKGMKTPFFSYSASDIDFARFARFALVLVLPLVLESALALLLALFLPALLLPLVDNCMLVLARFRVLVSTSWFFSGRLGHRVV